MNKQKKYRWKVLHKIVKETTVDKNGFIHLPTLIGEQGGYSTFRGYSYLPKDMPPSLFSYLKNIYGLQKNEKYLLWRKYCDKINKLIKK